MLLHRLELGLRQGLNLEDAAIGIELGQLRPRLARRNLPPGQRWELLDDQ